MTTSTTSQPSQLAPTPSSSASQDASTRENSRLNERTMRSTHPIVILLLCVCSACPLSGQVLTRSLNLPRPGDVLQKQAMQHIRPCATGHDAVWDFSDAAELEGEELEEAYKGREDSVLTDITRYSAYGYCLLGDSLMCLGYTAPNLEVSYLRPQLSMHYPMSCGDSICSLHYGEGVYSHKLHMAVYGESWCKAAGEGVIVLPEGDTLRHVMLLHGHSRLGQRLSPSCRILSLSDSTVLSSDTILQRLATDSVTWTLDTYRWYAAGYRYPVFETTEADIIRDGQAYPHIRSTYYLPAYVQAWLEDDRENEELRELLAEADRQAQGRGARDGSNGGEAGDGSDASQIPFNYSTSFSGDGNRLDMDFSFESNCEVQFQLSTVQGYLLARTPKRNVAAGSVRETFDLSSARANVYMLSVMVDGNYYTLKVTKQ